MHIGLVILIVAVIAVAGGALPPCSEEVTPVSTMFQCFQLD